MNQIERPISYAQHQYNLGWEVDMSFGRKGLMQGAAQPSPAARGAFESETRAPRLERSSSDAAELAAYRGRLATIALGIVVALLTLDAMLSGASLITPLSKDLTFYVTVTAAVLGLMWGVYTWLFSPTFGRGVRTSLGLFLGAPLLAGAWANVVVWQLARDYHFTFSDEKWEAAEYAVTGFGRPSRRSFGFSHHTVRIDPFDVGGDTDIPIPEEQYDQFFTEDYDTLCVTVQQRRAPSGAIEVATNGSFNLSSPQPANIHRCGMPS